MSPHDEGGFFDFADNFGGYPARKLVYIIPPWVCPASLAPVDLDTLRYLSKHYCVCVWYTVRVIRETRTNCIS